MAWRHCGSVKLHVVCHDKGEDGRLPWYRVTFSIHGKWVQTVDITMAADDRARWQVDDARAIDAVAREAIGYALPSVRSYGERDGSAWKLRRKQ